VLLASFGLDRQAFWKSARCGHPSAKLDVTSRRQAELLVTGTSRMKTSEQHFCTTYRGQESGCGELGRFWEARR